MQEYRPRLKELRAAVQKAEQDREFPARMHDCG